MNEEVFLREGEEFIKLGQFLKKAGVVQTGSEAKIIICDGLIEVNGEKELRRGRKLYEGDIVKFEESLFKVVSP